MYTRAERMLAVAGLLLGIGLAVLCLDVIAGGRITGGTRRECDGCGEDGGQPGDDDGA